MDVKPKKCNFPGLKMDVTPKWIILLPLYSNSVNTNFKLYMDQWKHSIAYFKNFIPLEQNCEM